MPSGYTHIMLSRKCREKIQDTSFDLFSLLQSKGKYYQLGALGPDLPYSQIVFGLDNDDEDIADLFHYQKTNQLFLASLEEIKKLPTGDLQDEAFAFFLGFASHIVADGVIHPFIRDKVGDYDDNKTDHRTLEMRIDVYLYDEFYGGNLNFSNLHDQMLDVFKKDFSHVSDLMSKLLKNIYGVNLHRLRVEKWVKDMNMLFGAAEGENNHYYSNIKVGKIKPGDFLFPDIKDILNRKEEDLFLGINEANGVPVNFANRDIHFIKDCIPMYENVFSNIASKAYAYVYEGKDKLAETDFQAINLDTGRSLAVNGGKNLDTPVILWS